MSIIHTELPAETVPPPVTDAQIIVMIEDLREMQEKAIELAAQQLELTKQLESALTKARELHTKTLSDRIETGGEA
jgi:hypothetical protein